MRRTSWKFGTGWPFIWEPHSSDLKHYNKFSIFHSHYYTWATNGLAIYWKLLIFCVYKCHDFTGILLRSYLFISSSQTSLLCCKGFFKVYMSSWTTTVPFLLPPLKVCMSQVPDALNRSLWGQSPTLRHLYSHLPAMTANCPCCQMPWQLCQSEGWVVALG